MSEARVMAGAEPSYSEENNNVGVLVSHVYTGSPQSMRPLAEGWPKKGSPSRYRA